MRSSIFWVDGNRFLVSGPRFHFASCLIIEHANLVPDIGIFRLDLQVTLVLVNRSALFPELLASHAEVVIRIHILRVKLDRLFVLLLRAL